MSTREMWRGSGAGTQIAVLTGRSLRALVADPRAAVLGAVGPVLMLLIFGQVFGSIADSDLLPAGVRYIDYLTPALVVTTGISAAQVSGQALVRDMHNGVYARLRSMPVRQFSLLVARSLADLVRYGAQMVVLLVFAALALGFRPAGIGGLCAGLLVGFLLTWALIWTFLALAAWLRSGEVLQSLGVLMFPVMFASSAFAPLDQLPAWLRFIAMGNPLTYGVDALRAAVLGLPGGSLVAALVAAVVLGLVSAGCAVRTFARPHRA